MSKDTRPDPLSYNEILAYQYRRHQDEPTPDGTAGDQATSQQSRTKPLIVVAVAAAVTAVVATLAVLSVLAGRGHDGADATVARSGTPSSDSAVTPVPFPMVTRINGLYRIVHHRDAVVTQSPLPNHSTLELTPMDTDQVFVSAFTTECTPSECTLTRYPLDQDDTSRPDEERVPLRFRLINGEYVEMQPIQIRAMGRDSAGQPCQYSEKLYGTYSAPVSPERFDGFFTEEVTSDECLTKGAKGVSRIDVERIGDLPPELQARLNS